MCIRDRTLLEALNTDLVFDAINTAMRELFLQIVYGRTQSAFSEDGLPVGAGLEDLGKGLRSPVSYTHLPIPTDEPHWIDHIPVGFYVLEETLCPYDQGYVPVSYTHLDVYKRQALIRQRQTGRQMRALQ